MTSLSDFKKMQILDRYDLLKVKSYFIAIENRSEQRNRDVSHFYVWEWDKDESSCSLECYKFMRTIRIDFHTTSKTILGSSIILPGEPRWSKTWASLMQYTFANNWSFCNICTQEDYLSYIAENGWFTSFL